MARYFVGKIGVLITLPEHKFYTFKCLKLKITGFTNKDIYQQHIKEINQNYR